MSGKPLENHPAIESMTSDLRGSDEAAVERAAFELVRCGAKDALPIIIARFLASTGTVRNRLAVALGDARDDEARAALVTALRDPVTRGHRGSIVYALRAYGSDGIVGDLINCVLDGTYEEAEHALDMLARAQAGTLATVSSDWLRRVRDAAKREDGWRRDAADACLDVFDSAADELEAKQDMPLRTLLGRFDAVKRDLPPRARATSQEVNA